MRCERAMRTHPDLSGRVRPLAQATVFVFAGWERSPSGGRRALSQYVSGSWGCRTLDVILVTSRTPACPSNHRQDSPAQGRAVVAPLEKGTLRLG